jgi:signal transduction histidine kinase
MVECEISFDLELDDTQRVRVEMHSFVNVMNVLMAELHMLRMVMRDPLALSHSLQLCDNILMAFNSMPTAAGALEEMERARPIILSDIRVGLADTRIMPDDEPFVEVSIENVQAMLGIIELRVREMLARRAMPSPWRIFTPLELRADLRQVFNTMQRRSRGRYGIVFSADLHTGSDYLIELKLSPPPGEENFFLPAAIPDTLRDLVANSRKYSLPGTRITAELMDDGECATLRVSDEGRGIPGPEIERVVRFGVRGTNVREDETRGGGFGLTKAYYLCRQFGGRMWIASEPGRGTVVTLRLPSRKPALSAAAVPEGNASEAAPPDYETLS